MDVSLSRFHSDRNLLSSQMETALILSAKGWLVFPVHYPINETLCSCGHSNCKSAGKHPMTRRGLKDASNDRNQILRWWQKEPMANTGLVTGRASGLLVIDIDPRHGGYESLQKLEDQYGKLPETLTVQTGGNGKHFYFQYPVGDYKNKAGLLPGIDIRAEGGYVVAPSSTHASMKTYEWEDQSTPIAALPAWFLNLLAQPKPTSQQPTSSSQPFQEGSRHQSIVSLGGFLKSKGLEHSQVLESLTQLNKSLCNPPLEAEEIQTISKSLENYSETPWSEPVDIPESPKAPCLHPSLLPSGIRPWCTDIADRMQVPLEYVAGPAIIMLASLIGRKIAVSPNTHDDWHVTPNLWGMVVAPPGSMKSPSISAVLKPLYKITRRAQEVYKQEKARLKEDEEIAKSEVAALKEGLKSAVKQGTPAELQDVKTQLAQKLKELESCKSLTEKRYLTNDPTIEKLVTIMQENPQGVLLYRDEISGWLAGMSKPGKEGDREFFLESWNGDTPYSMDRVGRGSTYVDGLCLSVLGGLQPGKFDDYIASIAKGGRSDDGLLQRFQILLYPDRKKSWKPCHKSPDAEAYMQVEKIVEVIDNMPNPEKDSFGEVQSLILKFSDDAQVLFDDWRENLESRLCKGSLHPMMESHLSKYRSLMPSLAAIFSLIQSINETGTIDFTISAEAAKLSVDWCRILEQHANKAFGDHLSPELDSARHFVAKLNAGKIKDFDRCRDIYRRGWKGLKTAEELEKALEVLERHNIARTQTLTPATGGKTEVIRLHPKWR